MSLDAESVSEDLEAIPETSPAPKKRGPKPGTKYGPRKTKEGAAEAKPEKPKVSMPIPREVVGLGVTLPLEVTSLVYAIRNNGRQLDFDHPPVSVTKQAALEALQLMAENDIAMPPWLVFLIAMPLTIVGAIGMDRVKLLSERQAAMIQRERIPDPPAGVPMTDARHERDRSVPAA